jgi:hypothetical protein
LRGKHSAECYAGAASGDCGSPDLVIEQHGPQLSFNPAPTVVISASEIEGIVEQAFKHQFRQGNVSIDQLPARVEMVTIKKNSVSIQFNNGADNSNPPIEVQRGPGTLNDAKVIFARSDREPDQKLLQAVVRANAWLVDLASGDTLPSMS